MDTRPECTRSPPAARIPPERPRWRGPRVGSRSADSDPHENVRPQSDVLLEYRPVLDRHLLSGRRTTCRAGQGRRIGSGPCTRTFVEDLADRPHDDDQPDHHGKTHRDDRQNLALVVAAGTPASRILWHESTPLRRTEGKGSAAETACHTAPISDSSSSTATADQPHRRYFFVHLQKTAGTSLVWMLRKQFGRAAVYPDDSDGRRVNVASVLSVDHLQGRLAVRGDDIKVITGHYPLCVRELVGNPITLTVLRDPVERTLSYLRHHRDTTPADSDLSLEEIYEDPFRFRGMVHNHMVKMFSLTPEEMTDGLLTVVDFDQERLERAKEQLATVDAVGLQEDFEDFGRRLQDQFGWELGPERHLNRSDETPVSVAFRSRIATDNPYDLELFAFAQELVGRL